MTVACQIVTVQTPAVITATTITITPSLSCTAPCIVSAEITWTNQGEAIGNFTPGITVDGTPSTPYPAQDLGGGLTVTKTFSITGLTAGSHTICPSPN